jgi:hypothetical protein
MSCRVPLYQKCSNGLRKYPGERNSFPKWGASWRQPSVIHAEGAKIKAPRTVRTGFYASTKPRSLAGHVDQRQMG